MSYCFKLVYKLSKYISTRIFGEDFVKNNKNKFKIIYNNKKYQLKQFFEEIDEHCKQREEVKFKLIIFHNILHLGKMFYLCDNLLSISKNEKHFSKKSNHGLSISKNKEKEPFKIIDFNFMFFGCESMISIPDISEWNTEKILNMSGLFYGCKSLISLPDISKWNTNHVIDISNLFYGCKSLISLPDISKWNTNNVTNMSNLFYECNSLLSLPDISKWNTNNVTNMSNLFRKCNSLTSLPDISVWNTEKVINMFCLFYGCKSLISLPDISKWNTKNITNINHIFYGCKSLRSIPDITNWNTENLYYHFELAYKYDDDLRILGTKFVNNNINTCYIEYNFKILELCEFRNNSR